jgi:hypothetical protein
MMTRSRLFVSIVVSVMAFAVACTTATSAFAARTIALSSGTVELSLASGGVARERFMVANNGDEPLKAMVYASDIIYDKKGVPTYKKPTGTPGELLKSPASWLTLRLPASTQLLANTPYIELEPGEEMELNYEMKVPANATPGDYNSVIFFQMFETDSAEPGASSTVSGRIGARIVVRVKGEVVDRLDLAPFAVRNFVIGDTVPYSFTLTNKGNIDKRFVPSLVVLDSSEKERMRTVVETSSVIYAQNSREYAGVVPLEGVSFGKLTMRAEVSYEKETESTSSANLPEVLSKERTFWVVPTWVVVVVVLLVGLPVLWLSYRASVRSKGRHSAAPRATEVRSRREAPARRPVREPREPRTEFHHADVEDDGIDLVKEARRFREAHPEIDDDYE